jgi:DNA primase
MQLLERAGLFSKNDKGHVYDKFRDRLMFPIHDRRGRVIAFGGRVLDPEDSPKYLNSPETALFHKGRELYGLWQAKQANPKLERLVVVEGYMDVVALAQYGVTQAVATLGTATTPDHAELLFRNAPDVFFCFDGDRAGRSAAWKALESVLPRMKDGRQALFLFLPEGEDPDSIVRKEGSAGFEARLQQATSLSDFFFAEHTRDVNLETLEGRARLAERAKPQINAIPDGAFRDLMLQRLAELARLNAPAATPASPAPPVRRPPQRGAPAQKRSLVRLAITMLVQQPSLALAIEPPTFFSTLRQPGVELLTKLISLVRARPEISTGALLEEFEGTDDFAVLSKLAVEELLVSQNWTQEFLGALKGLDVDTLKQRQDELNSKLAATGNYAALTAAERRELSEILPSIRRLESELKAMSQA